MTALKEHETHLDVFTDDKKVIKKLDEILKAKRPGADHEPGVQMGSDDGYTRFYKATNVNGGKYFKIQRGFLSRISNSINFTQAEYLPKEVMPDKVQFLKKIMPTLPFKPYKHQLQAFMSLTEGRNNLSIVATGGGKSMIAYLVLRYFYDNNIKSILVVPTIGLTSQMYQDAKDYANIDNKKKKVEQLVSEVEKDLVDMLDILKSNIKSCGESEKDNIEQNIIYYESLLEEMQRNILM